MRRSPPSRHPRARRCLRPTAPCVPRPLPHGTRPAARRGTCAPTSRRDLRTTRGGPRNRRSQHPDPAGPPRGAPERRFSPAARLAGIFCCPGAEPIVLSRCQRDVNQRPQPTATGEPESGSIQRDLRLGATRRNRLRRNGKEGVDGSSPSEGFRNSLQMGHVWRFLFGQMFPNVPLAFPHVPRWAKPVGWLVVKGFVTDLGELIDRSTIARMTTRGRAPRSVPRPTTFAAPRVGERSTTQGQAQRSESSTAGPTRYLDCR